MIYFPPLLKHFDIPVGNHYGSFGVKRKYEHHSGIDLYTPENTPVYAIESGKVIEVNWFTGPEVGSDWWFSTKQISIEGDSGVIIYGEINTLLHIETGYQVNQSEHIGNVVRVLRHDKGRPLSMLHIELLKHGYKNDDIPIWELDKEKPDGLLDPTNMLIQCQTNQVVHHIF